MENKILSKIEALYVKGILIQAQVVGVLKVKLAFPRLVNAGGPSRAAVFEFTPAESIQRAAADSLIFLDSPVEVGVYYENPSKLALGESSRRLGTEPLEMYDTLNLFYVAYEINF